MPSRSARSTGSPSAAAQSTSFALMAATALLLAHLDSRNPRHGYSHGQNFLAHQRFSDRAMVEQVPENMDTIAASTMDILTEESRVLLRQLLAIEDDAARGNSTYSAQTVDASEQAIPSVYDCLSA